ncbi:MAG: NADH-quinone oxidoreductase subunit NuoE [Planctomycetota bacterium]|jgi:NADH-quinone oxidoreductase subunit E|nr:NADH-quinone oxidoreductase subunit NuoE [Planctomycetota bacterium]MDP7130179.1 NADH-quinone oxidoreductase subunit NuoE [Planctomycetota bacterium]MDP7248830.1 NADH-quinone oxidoreductase subunit NuoE [Planctomycetota bacterium]
MNLEMLDEIMREYDYGESGLISMLQDIQREENYLPESEMRAVAERVGVPASRIYSLATFYKSFSLKPRGKHLVNVCTGTACHVKGGDRLMDKCTRELDVEPGETTDDGNFTVEPVRCVGCCGLAPVVVVDGEFQGKMTQRKVSKMLERCD